MKLIDIQKEKIRKKEAVIGIVGLGYVGLPLASSFLKKGFKVTGFDVDETKIKCLEQGKNYIEHLDLSSITRSFETGFFFPTTDFSNIRSVDVIIICVPTPLNSHREPDLSFVIGSLNTVLPHLQKGQLLCLESTTYPGTTEEELRPGIENAGFIIGEDFFLVYSPEREDPNNPRYRTENIPKICGGTTSACSELGKILYEQVIEKVVPVSSTQAAEMTKILENTFRAVNIALVNELKLVAEKMDIDIYEVIRAAATKPFGYMPFFPGPGLGGHCIPIDPFYLTWKAREYGVTTKFIELAGEVNVSMPDYVVSRTMSALNEEGVALSKAKILVLGLAYKKNVGDVRESPSVVLLEKLMKMGADVSYSDPHVPRFPRMRKYKMELNSVDITQESLKEYDCVLIVTDHDAFDWEMVLENSRKIIDTRGVFSVSHPKVIRG